MVYRHIPIQVVVLFYSLILFTRQSFAEDQKENDSWVRYESKEFGFVMELPSEPRVAQADSPSALSEAKLGKAQFFLEATDKQAGVVYQVTVFSVDGLRKLAGLGAVGRGVLSQLMKTSSDLAVVPIAGKKISDCEIMMFGNPGRSFTALGVHDGLPAMASCRTFVMDGSLFLLMVVQNGPATVSLKDGMRFFGSFQSTLAPSDDPPFQVASWSAKLGADRFNINHHYSITYTLKNQHKKGIKLIDASLHFSDLLGTIVYTIKLNQDVRIPAEGTSQSSGQWPINSFEPEQGRLARIPKDDVVTTLVIRRVVFDDNTILTLE
jgi:hypothetical protein